MARNADRAICSHHTIIPTCTASCRKTLGLQGQFEIYGQYHCNAHLRQRGQPPEKEALGAGVRLDSRKAMYLIGPKKLRYWDICLVIGRS